MINIHFALRNPWAKENFDSLYEASGKIGKHNAWEVQVTRYAHTLLEFTFRWTMCDDHAGPYLELGLFGYSMIATIYDCRHWDYEKKTWVVYPK
jgi:hypothetical protein